jgi:nucleoside-diphosphate-sugar epimerase
MKPLNMKILVTGATGFVGGAVAAELAKHGLLAQTIWMVRAADTASGRQRLLENLARFDGYITADHIPESNIVCADLAEPESLSQSAWVGVTHVIHCAALTTFSKNHKIWAMNVEGTLALARAVQAQGALQRWIQVGTAMSCGPGLASPVSESWELGQTDTAHLVPYTHSKIAVELALRELPHFPLVVARPSIVVGHSQLGCSPSPSIFWVFRMAVALERFTCAISERIDIIPVDWCAKALVHLCLKPKLAHDLYHVSAGNESSNDFSQIDATFAAAQGTEPVGERYQQVALEDLSSLVPLFEARLGKVNRILILRALTLYGAFAKLNYVFDNQRLLAEGVQAAPSFTSYLAACVITSQHSPLLEQMAHDFK